MPKGYWIVRVTVRDADHYPEYLAAAQVAFEKYGANFLVRGGNFEAPEGAARERNVVVEFKDLATAIACYRSAEYRAAKSLRQKYAETDFIIIEGAAGTAARPSIASNDSHQEASQDATNRDGILRRVLDAFMQARQRRAELHIRRLLRAHGDRLTDDVERRIMRTTIENFWF